MTIRTRKIPKPAGQSFEYFDRLLGTIEQLINDTAWPDPDYTNAIPVRQWVDDVYELSAAMRAEAVAGRWTTAILLIRPLYERSQYALAVAIKPTFGEEIRQYLREEFLKKSKSRHLVEKARGINARWAESRGQSEFLQGAASQSRFASDVQHHATGWSQSARESPESRRDSLETLCYCVKEALAGVVLAIEAMEAHDTVTWRRARSTVAQTY